LLAEWGEAGSNSGQPGGPGFYEITGTAEFGWIIRGDEGTPRSARACDSRKNHELRPLLTVVDSLTVATGAATWSGVKALFD
jgi:hypothetical protein